MALVAELQKALGSGRMLYIHCMGGHGRTGTVVANLIGRTYISLRHARHHIAAARMSYWT